MLRAVLAVLVAVAIVAVSQPVLQQGRQDHAATVLAEEVDGVVTAASDLVRTDEAIDGPGARRIVTVELPSSRRFSAGTNYVEITGGEVPRIEWAVDGGASRSRRIEGLTIRTDSDGPLRLAGDGERRLLLELAGSAADPTVVIGRFESTDGESDA